MTLYTPQSKASELASYIADGLTEADFLHDNCTQCECCKSWFTDDGSDFHEGIYQRVGEFVCHECAPDYLEEATYDEAREHGTLWAHYGSVVG